MDLVAFCKMDSVVILFLLVLSPTLGDDIPVTTGYTTSTAATSTATTEFVSSPARPLRSGDTAQRDITNSVTSVLDAISSTTQSSHTSQDVTKWYATTPASFATDAFIPTTTNSQNVKEITHIYSSAVSSSSVHPVSSNETPQRMDSTAQEYALNLNKFGSTTETPAHNNVNTGNDSSTSAFYNKDEHVSSTGSTQNDKTHVPPTASPDIQTIPIFGLLDQFMPALASYQGLYEDFEKLMEILPEEFAAGLQQLVSEFSNLQSLTQCKLDLLQAVTGAKAKENWALQLFDSWGKPGPSLLKDFLSNVGNYHQCRDVRAPPMTGRGEGYKGNYCAVQLNPWSNISLPLAGSVFSVGTCMPETCSEEEITKLVQTVLEAFHLNHNLTVSSTDCRSDHREVTGATVLAIVFLSIIGLLLILGTTCDVILIQWPRSMASRDQKETREADPENLAAAKDDGRTRIGGKDPAGLPYHLWNQSVESSLDNSHCERPFNGTGHGAIGPPMKSETSPLLDETDNRKFISSIPGKILLSFSVYTNGSKLLSTAQSSNSLTAIHGLRAISIAWIIFSHLHIIGIAYNENLPEASATVYGERSYDFITNGFLSVDTFFVISGLLTAYIIYTKMVEKGWKLNWAVIFLHRVWRLTPPYMLVLVTILGLQRFMGSGPLWATEQPVDKENCENYWWTNMLYINNFVKPSHICMLQSWYMAADMQLFLLSPFILIALYLNVYAGLGLSLVCVLINWIVSGVMSAEEEWPTTVISLFLHGRQHDVNKFMREHYYSFYGRLGPYVLGMLAGYWLVISKKILNIPWYVAVVGWTVAIATMNIIVYGVHDDLEEDPLDTSVAALYNALSRTAWGICICWVIIACATGYGGPINILLSWSPFVVLGKLSYMMYLTHMSIIYIYCGNRDQFYHWTETNMPVLFSGILVFTVLISFVLCLAFESPLLAVEKIWLRRK